MGATPQRLAKEASLLRRSGLSPAAISNEAGIGAHPVNGDQFRRSFGHQPIELLVESWISSESCW